MTTLLSTLLCGAICGTILWALNRQSNKRLKEELESERKWREDVLKRIDHISYNIVLTDSHVYELVKSIYDLTAETDKQADSNPLNRQNTEE